MRALVYAVVMQSLLIGTDPVEAQQKKYKAEFNLHVVVHSEEPAKSQLESYCKRELREIKEIAITGEEEAEYILHILSVRSGEYEAVTFVLFEQLHLGTIEIMLENANVPPNKEAVVQDAFRALLKGKGEIVYLASANYGVKRLKKLCKEEVATIDAKVIEEHRATADKLNKIMGPSKEAAVKRQ